jgi:hypothetical protein
MAEEAPWVNYVGPLGAKPRKLKLDISDTELVESHHRIELRSRWPDLAQGAAIDGYTLDEVAAERSAALPSACSAEICTTCMNCSMVAWSIR